MSNPADVRTPPGADDPSMTYITIHELPGRTMDDFEAVREALHDPEPAGLLARYAGVADGALTIIGVWADKTVADRFEADDLAQATRQVAAAAAAADANCPVGGRAIHLAPSSVHVAPAARTAPAASVS